jgi:hypothetical protein
MLTETRLVLGQALPGGSVLAVLYTVPAATQAVVSTIMVCNESNQPTTYSLSIAVAGAADALAQYIAYQAPLLANESKGYTIGITLGPADVIRCLSASGQVAFSAFGVQIA